MSPLSETDERVDKQPPGDPPLEPDGVWPTYRFDAGNTGANPDGSGLRDAEEYWRLDAGGAAAVAGGRLFNLYARGEGSTTLTVRDPTTATVETRTSLVEYGTQGPPTVAAGRAFVATFIEVIAVDITTAQESWRTPPMDGIQGRPTVYDGRVLVATGDFDESPAQLRAFGLEGDQRWRYDLASTGLTPAVSEGTVYVTDKTGLHAVDLDTGEQVFHQSMAASDTRPAVVRDGVVYAVDTPDEKARLVAVNADGGTVRWTVTLDPGFHDVPPVATTDAVYARTEHGLSELDPADGQVVASTDTPARPMCLVGSVLHGAVDGRVVAFDVDNDLRQLWSLTTEEVTIQDTVGRTVYHVAPVRGAVYVAARDGFHGVGPTR